MVPLYYHVTLGVLLFAIGAFGFIVRKNVLVAFMCIELMLNAVNLLFVAFSQITGSAAGNVAVIFVMVVAACEAAVGLAIVIAMFRAFRSVSTQDAAELQG
jgi:NADH-quinone oxidoreductase subunit K